MAPDSGSKRARPSRRGKTKQSTRGRGGATAEPSGNSRQYPASPVSTGSGNDPSFPSPPLTPGERVLAACRPPLVGPKSNVYQQRETPKLLDSLTKHISRPAAKRLIITLDALASILVEKRGQVFAVALQFKGDKEATIWYSASHLMGGTDKTKCHLDSILAELKTLRKAASDRETREQTSELVSVEYTEHTSSLVVQIYVHCSPYLKEKIKKARELQMPANIKNEYSKRKVDPELEDKPFTRFLGHLSDALELDMDDKGWPAKVATALHQANGWVHERKTFRKRADQTAIDVDKHEDEDEDDLEITRSPTSDDTESESDSDSDSEDSDSDSDSAPVLATGDSEKTRSILSQLNALDNRSVKPKYKNRNKYKYARVAKKLLSIDTSIRNLLVLTQSASMGRFLGDDYKINIEVIPAQKRLLHYDFKNDEELLKLLDKEDLPLGTRAMYLQDLDAQEKKKKKEHFGIAQHSSIVTLHAEAVLLAHFIQKGIQAFGYIAVSKLSCPGCYCLFKAWNKINEKSIKQNNEYYVRGAHSNVYPWLLPKADWPKEMDAAFLQQVCEFVRRYLTSQLHRGELLESCTDSLVSENRVEFMGFNEAATVQALENLQSSK